MAGPEWVSVLTAAQRLRVTAADLYDLIDAGVLRARRMSRTEDVSVRSLDALVAAQDDAAKSFQVTVAGVVFAERDRLRHLWTCCDCDAPVLDVDRVPHARVNHGSDG